MRKTRTRKFELLVQDRSKSQTLFVYLLSEKLGLWYKIIHTKKLVIRAWEIACPTLVRDPESGPQSPYRKAAVVAVMLVTPELGKGR